MVYVDLERDNLINIIENHPFFSNKPVIPQDLSPITGDDGLPLPELDMYYVMLSSYLGVEEYVYDEDFSEQLKLSLSPIGKVDKLLLFQGNILILMKKSTMKRPSSFKDVHQILFKVTSSPYASLYREQIDFHELDKTCQTLINCLPLYYCLGAQCMTLSQLSNKYKKRPQTSVYPLITQLVDLLFEGNESSLLSVLREFYLHRVRDFTDLHALKNFYLWLSFLEDTLFKNYLPFKFPKNYQLGSIDNELEEIYAYWSKVLQLYLEKPFLPVVEAAIRKLLVDYGDSDFSLGTLAEKIGFASAYVSRVFKEQTSLNLTDFLNQLRLQHATNLLRETSLPIKEIALRTGYSDAQYFSKVFRLQMSLHPTGFRDSHKQEVSYACLDS